MQNKVHVRVKGHTVSRVGGQKIKILSSNSGKKTFGLAVNVNLNGRSGYWNFSVISFRPKYTVLYRCNVVYEAKLFHYPFTIL